MTGPMFERGRRELFRHRLPLFALGWCATTIAWGAALTLQSRLTIFPATLLFTFQLGILIAAIAICHAKASTAHVPLVVLAACVLLGLSSTGLFAAIGGAGDMLLFLLLTLFLASTPLFAWSGRAALILIVGTLLPWVLALPFLHFALRPDHLAGALGLSAVICLAMLRWSQHHFRRALIETVTSDARRAVTEDAAHVMFAVDGSERFLYVNRTLAGMVRIATEDMVGLPFATFFTPDDPGEEPIRLADAIARPDGMRWRLRSTAGEVSFQIIAWVSRDPDSGDAVYGLGREATEAPELAPEIVRPPIDALPVAPVPIVRPTTPFSVLQEPLRLIGDEEVHRLREEVSRLRREVLEQSGSAPGRPRRRPPRPMDAPSAAASGLETGETSSPRARRRKIVSRSLSGE